jgi:RHH-type proline utilization regulon transcriptional repressor/proline dehydrogenase/delta 1-pyrroline-5-carboxylate dehydrogenase
MAAPLNPQRLEDLTRELGAEMFERMRGSNPHILQPLWWEERLLEQCMRDEWFKVQAFRFIDALPMMTTDTDIARHLKEYFVRRSHHAGSAHGHSNGHPNGRADRAALEELAPRGRSGLARWAGRMLNFSRCDSLPAKLAARFARFGARTMSHRFIAGSTPDEAVRTIRRMRDQQLAFTIDVLGEAAVSEVESAHYFRIYHDLITQLARHAQGWPVVPLADTAEGRPIPRVNVSIKLTSLFSQFDAIDPEGTRRAVKERLRPLLRAAMKDGVHVHIDMEHYAIKDITLEICREVFLEPEFRDYPHLGIVLQAYLTDSERDARETIEYARRRGTPLWVRLVKGAYWDVETVVAAQNHWECPVWTQKWQSDACYERISRLLAENHDVVHTAFASHNVRSLAHAMALRNLLEIPAAHFELQMLYGMGDPIKKAAVEMGQRSRVYTPYGEMLPGMAYLIRRLLENTANESFLRHTVSADTPVEELLDNPENIGRRTPPPEPPVILRYEFEELVMDPFVNVPNTDFARTAGRDQFQAALARVRADLGRQYPIVINGERLTTGEWHDSINPSRPAEVVGKLAAADAQLAERAAQVAHEAFKSWRKVGPHERAECLFAAARIMQSRRFELAALQCLECGKPWREADADVSEAIDFCNFYGKEMIRISDHYRRRDIPGETNEYIYTPRGVVAVISPWNFPLAIMTGMVTAALVTGNAVVYKPAEQAAVTGYKLLEVLEAAGIPRGVVNFVPGRGSIVGEALVHSRYVAMIAFTGSQEVGMRINRVAAETPTVQPALKKVIAEMGGKNATIIDTDADLDEAVKGVLYSAFGYAGQKCSAGSRCIVLEPVYERFVSRLVEAGRSLQVGPADDPGTFVPPVIDKPAYNKIREYIEIGKTEARCALEVDTSELVKQTGGFFIGPTIFVDVPPTARVAREEIFGPVLSVIKAADMDEAIEIFNGVDFALTGGIFSRSPAHLERARVELECGNLYINRKITGALVDLQPFGGFKMSGLGSKAGGPDYLTQFCEPRTITENTLRRGFAPSEEVVEAVS